MTTMAVLIGISSNPPLLVIQQLTASMCWLSAGPLRWTEDLVLASGTESCILDTIILGTVIDWMSRPSRAHTEVRICRVTVLETGL